VSKDLKDEVDIKDFMYRIAHSPAHADSFRNQCAEQIATIMAAHGIAEGNTPQIFPGSEAELNELIAGLPHLPEPASHLDETKDAHERLFVTQEAIAKKRAEWSYIYLNLPPENQILHKNTLSHKRLAMHLNSWLALQDFLNSDYKYYLKFENDVKIQERFVAEAIRVIPLLPVNWDYFNFIVPDNAVKNYQEYLRIRGTDLTKSYQGYPAATMLISRSGAEKYLTRFLDHKTLDISLNGLRNGDTFVHNCHLYHEGNKLRWQIDLSESRTFKTYTYIPNTESPVSWREGHSTWNQL